MVEEPTARIISCGTRKMPLPIIVPTTIAVACETPRTRGRSPGCTGAAVWRVSADVMSGARLPLRVGFSSGLDFGNPSARALHRERPQKAVCHDSFQIFGRFAAKLVFVDHHVAVNQRAQQQGYAYLGIQ